MLTQVNVYIHGYVAIALIDACKRCGVVTLLEEKKDPLNEQNLNFGYTSIALQALESLGWIEKIGDTYSVTEAASFSDVPDDIANLYQFPFDNYLAGNNKLSLQPWFDLLRTQSDKIRYLLEGSLIVPLLVTLQQYDLFKLPLEVKKELFGFFEHQGWMEKQKLTPMGRQMIERAYVMAIGASYAPMLRNIDKLLKGKSHEVFARSQTGQEQHVDRTINVKASGFQHEKYFKDAEVAILSIFNEDSFDLQPRYIADMGCGDGNFLKELFILIKEKSNRGKVLDTYPLTLIGIDYNEEALAETEKTLQGLSYITLKGDISQPKKLILDLQARGCTDTDSILHIRSFLDHNRPYSPPSTSRCHPGVDYHGVYIDSEGSSVKAVNLMDNLVEHLEQWAMITNKHGLLLLESHALAPKWIQAHFEKTESFYFDTIHALSGQYLVEAEKFLKAAATAQLFPKTAPLKFPKTLPFTRITLTHLEKRDYKIRYAEEKDLASLEELEKSCWQTQLQVKRELLQKRLQVYPEGQLVLEVDSKVVGVVYSQRIHSTEELKNITFEKLTSLHRPDGAIIQLLAINILPQMQQQNLGDQLLEFMLQRCSLMNGVEKVAGVTRTREYHNNTQYSYLEYLSQESDPILRFHKKHGAKIRGLIPNYRVADIDNLGNGILIEYDLQNRNKNEDVENFVFQTIKKLLGTKVFSPTTPLMEMGLDSADLLELGEQIRIQYAVKLEPAFFFEHNTAAKVIRSLEQKKPKSVLGKSSHKKLGEVAIVGVSFRLPGLHDTGVKDTQTLDELWKVLAHGENVITSLPDDRWKWPTPVDNCPGIDKGGFLCDIAGFDAPFFRVSAMEAAHMDPQQRILLELSWHAVQDAGYDPNKLFGSLTGVFIGASGSDYNRLLDQNSAFFQPYAGSGSSMSLLANRISYFYDFHGPSLQVDTACSSSLVALHQACRSIQNGECSTALVGAINIMCHPAATLSYYKAGMLSSDGLCKTFDESANGYVRSEGACMILIKSLEQAISDGDHIYGVIRGATVNHGGQAGGLTVPNPESQALLVQAAIDEAGVEKETISYIEAHGTGTALGDPIEISGLKKVFGNNLPLCGVGSCKSNFGHLEAAAGMVGLLKVLACLHYKQLVPTANYKNLNAHIQLNNSPFYIVDARMPWNISAHVHPRRAGISSFGSGGTNAHVLVEEFQGNNPPLKNLKKYPFVHKRYWYDELPQEEHEVRTFQEVWEPCQITRSNFVPKSIFCYVTNPQIQHEIQTELKNLSPNTALYFPGDIFDSVESIWYLSALEKQASFGDFHSISDIVRSQQYQRSLLLAAVHDSSLAACYSSSWIGFERSLSDASIASVFAESGSISQWVKRLFTVACAEKLETVFFKNELPHMLRLRPAELSEPKQVFRKNATYFITGGLGGLGEIVATHLAATHGPVQLVLLGRSAMDDAKYNKIKKLEALGSRILYLEGDVTNLKVMQECLKEAKANFGPIHGLIHAAGVLGNGTIFSNTPGDFEEVVAPKILGSVILHELLCDEPLETICYFSSIAAIFGDFGSCDYAIANRFQMAYGKMLKANVICWPLWKNGGMKLNNAETTHLYLKSSGQRMLETEEGLGLFESLVSDTTTSHIVLVASKNRVDDLVKRVTGQAEDCMIGKLKEQASSILSVRQDAIDIDANLADIGFDSIMLAAFAQALDITPSLFFVYPTLRKLRDHLSENVPIQAPRSQPKEAEEPIAIIGMSGRFPNARTIHEFWQILVEGKNGISEVEQNRKWIGLLPGIKEFDAAFFGISPREAKALDPRHRLLLQEGYRAIEDAGLSKAHLSTIRMGVFIGAEAGNYKEDASITANHEGILASRLSYFLDLDGPVMSINTSCSSSLVAAHQACMSLRAGECDVAIAGGVNLMLSDDLYFSMVEAGMLSCEGRCYAFDARANGLVPAEAVAAVVLKPLSKAKADGDPIYGVILGSGINYDGKTNGITAPSGSSQTKLVQSVYNQYHINPEEIEHIVTHGTGTKLGDPVEVNALIEAFKIKTKKSSFCALTSTKSTIGHSLAASGIVNLISLVLSLQHKVIPASLNYEEPNPYITWDRSPFFVNKTNRPYGANLKGAVSAFGMSGTNAHMVVERYEDVSASLPKPSEYILVLSAKTEKALNDKRLELIAFLKDKPDLLALSYTLLDGRHHYEKRLAVVGRDYEDLIQKLCNPQELANELVAKYCRGNNLQWQDVYQGKKPSRIHAPTYPFARDEYWVDESTGSLEGRREWAKVSKLDQNPNPLDIIAFQIGIRAEELDLERAFWEYGVDSIISMQIFGQLQAKVDPNLTLTSVLQCKTPKDLLNSLSKNGDAAILPSWPHFPELLRLNTVTSGRPIFWFHPGIGGVEIYVELSSRCKRPFFGIQARGFMTDRAPLHGVQAMASYYVHIVTSVQPTGPYDFGGYSLGGALAYEVCRQLQELGQQVNSIVMCDTLDSRHIKRINTTYKSELLQTVNTMLAAKVSKEPEKLFETMIHRDELNPAFDDDNFLSQLALLANKRGLSKTTTQLEQIIKQNAKVQKAYDIHRFFALPLTHPDRVQCYFFRNKNGNFWGHLEPYNIFHANETDLEQATYWAEWQKIFTNFHIIDVDALSHMTLLTQPAIKEDILQFCETLYGHERMVQECTYGPAHNN